MKGLLIVQLYERSPLSGLGVRGAQREVILGNQRVFVGGDILTAVDGVAVGSLDELNTLLESRYQVGDTVTATLYRGNREMTLRVTLAEEPMR